MAPDRTPSKPHCDECGPDDDCKCASFKDEELPHQEKTVLFKDEDAVAESTTPGRGDSKSSCSSGSIISNSSSILGPTLGATQKYESGSNVSSTEPGVGKSSQDQVGVDVVDFNDKGGPSEKGGSSAKGGSSEEEDFNEKEDSNEKDFTEEDKFSGDDMKVYRGGKKDANIGEKRKK